MRGVRVVLAAAIFHCGAANADGIPSSETLRDWFEAADFSPIPQLAARAFVLEGVRRSWDNGFDILQQRLARHFMAVPFDEDDGTIQTEIARALGREFSEDEILRVYAAITYFGRNCYGLDAAALAFFGRPPEELEDQELIYLAILPPAPSMFDMARKPELGRERYDWLVAQLRKDEALSAGDMADLRNAQLIVQPSDKRCNGTAPSPFQSR